MTKKTTPKNKSMESPLNAIGTIDHIISSMLSQGNTPTLEISDMMIVIPSKKGKNIRYRVLPNTLPLRLESSE